MFHCSPPQHCLLPKGLFTKLPDDTYFLPVFVKRALIMVRERKAFNVNSIIAQMRDNLGIICSFFHLCSLFLWSLTSKKVFNISRQWNHFVEQNNLTHWNLHNQFEADKTILAPWRETLPPANNMIKLAAQCALSVLHFQQVPIFSFISKWYFSTTDTGSNQNSFFSLSVNNKIEKFAIGKSLKEYLELLILCQWWRPFRSYTMKAELLRENRSDRNPTSVICLCGIVFQPGFHSRQMT